MRSLILVVDDEPAVRDLLRSQLEYLGYHPETTGSYQRALRIAKGDPAPAVVLLDIEMPEVSGVELLRTLKQVDDNLQVVMISGLHDLAIVRECLRSGAYDYLAKPFELEDLDNTIARALERQRLVRQNTEYQQDLERMVLEQTEEIRRTRDIALVTLARLAESRDNETGHHLERMAEYSRILATSLVESVYAEHVDEEFIEWVFKSSPLHDIGKVGIPDSILRKPGPLDAEEAQIMRTHTTIGGDTLRSVLEEFKGPTFLSMAMEIAYSHHERWDGQGYPYSMAENAIPLPARIVAIADAYDAITSCRPYKAALSHEEAMRRIIIDRGKHFDPILVDALLECQDVFAQVKERMQDQATLEAN